MEHAEYLPKEGDHIVVHLAHQNMPIVGKFVSFGDSGWCAILPSAETECYAVSRTTARYFLWSCVVSWGPIG